MKTLYENEMTNVNIPDHKMEKKNLSAEEMRQVSGGVGMGPSDCASSHHFLIEQRQREVLAEMQLKREQTADIRMRASEDALKAAMRLDRQEAEIKAAMRGHLEALGLN